MLPIDAGKARLTYNHTEHVLDQPVLRVPTASTSGPVSGMVFSPLPGDGIPPRPPAPSPTVAGLLKSLKRRWFPAVLAGLVLAIIAAAGAYYVLPSGRYTATTKLYLNSVGNTVFAPRQPQADFSNYLKTQQALIKSHLVLNSTLNRADVKALSMIQETTQPLEFLDRLIQVDTAGTPEIVKVNATGNRPEELVTLIQALTEAYMQEIVNKEKNERLEDLHRIDAHIDRFKGLIRTNQTQRKMIAEKMGSSDPQTLSFQQRLVAERLANQERDLQATQSEIRKHEAELAAPLATPVVSDVFIPEIEIDELLKRDPVSESHLSRIAQLEGNIDRLKLNVAAAQLQAASQRYLTELESTKRALAERRNALRPQLVELYRGKLAADRKAARAQSEQKLAHLKELERSLQKDVDRLTRETQTLNKSALELETLKEEALSWENTIKEMTNDRIKRDVEIQQPSRVALLEKAVLTQQNNDNRRLLGAGLAALAAFGFVLFGVSFWEFNSKRISGADDVVQGLGIRVMGVVPKSTHTKPITKGTNGVPVPLGHNVYTESVDSVRTMLLHSIDADGLRIIMVTSAVSGEGKTQLAGNLANSLARAGRRTLLVDGDLRRPAIHQLFDMPLGPGFAELLRGEASLNQLIRPAPANGLALVLAGRSDGHAVQALARGQIRHVLAQMRDQFDVVIVDCSPVLPVADALLMGQHVDGVILSVLGDVSSTPKVSMAYQRLNSLNVRILGAVLNGAENSELYTASYG